MGTNYYAVENVCRHCKRSERRHIGKSSAGWAFSLHVYPEEGINDWVDWVSRLKGLEIKDEYGRTVPFESLELTVTARSKRFKEGDFPAPGTLGQYGTFDEQIGLIRHRVDNNRVLRHGDGTWDNVVGDFS